jgi:hypothetical protein
MHRMRYMYISSSISSGFGCMFVFVVCVKLYLALVKEFLKTNFKCMFNMI